MDSIHFGKVLQFMKLQDIFQEKKEQNKEVKQGIIQDKYWEEIRLKKKETLIKDSYIWLMSYHSSTHLIRLHSYSHYRNRRKSEQTSHRCR